MRIIYYDKWLILIVILTIGWSIRIEENFSNRQVLVKNGFLSEVICRAPGRFSISYYFYLDVNGELDSFSIPKHRCDELQALSSKSTKVDLVYSRVGENDEVIQIFHEGKSFYSKEVVDELEAESRQRWSAYILPAFIILFRVFDIFGKRRLVSKSLS